MTYVLALIIVLFPYAIVSEDKSEKIENYDINPKYEKLKNQIEKLEQSILDKKQELQELFHPHDFAKRKQILTIIKAHKKIISEKIDRAYYAGKITNGEYFALQLKIESIQ